MEVVDKIADVDVNASDRPWDEVKMNKVTVETNGVKYPAPKRA